MRDGGRCELGGREAPWAWRSNQRQLAPQRDCKEGQHIKSRGVMEDGSETHIRKFFQIGAEAAEGLCLRKCVRRRLGGQGCRAGEAHVRSTCLSGEGHALTTARGKTGRTASADLAMGEASFECPGSPLFDCSKRLKNICYHWPELDAPPNVVPQQTAFGRTSWARFTCTDETRRSRGKEGSCTIC